MYNAKSVAKSSRILYTIFRLEENQQTDLFLFVCLNGVFIAALARDKMLYIATKCYT